MAPNVFSCFLFHFVRIFLCLFYVRPEYFTAGAVALAPSSDNHPRQGRGQQRSQPPPALPSSSTVTITAPRKEAGAAFPERPIPYSMSASTTAKTTANAAAAAATTTSTTKGSSRDSGRGSNITAVTDAAAAPPPSSLRVPGADEPDSTSFASAATAAAAAATATGVGAPAGQPACREARVDRQEGAPRQKERSQLQRSDGGGRDAIAKSTAAPEATATAAAAVRTPSPLRGGIIGPTGGGRPLVAGGGEDVAGEAPRPAAVAESVGAASVGVERRVGGGGEVGRGEEALVTSSASAVVAEKEKGKGGSAAGIFSERVRRNRFGLMSP